MIQGTANAGIAELKRKKLETAILGTIYLGLVGSKVVRCSGQKLGHKAKREEILLALSLEKRSSQ